MFVEAAVYESFLAKAKAKALLYRYGTGSDHPGREDVLQPVVSTAAIDRLQGLVDDARFVCLFV